MVALRSSLESPPNVAAKPGGSEHFHFAIWLGCALLILFAALTVHVRKPWDPDELRYAQIATEMKSTGAMFEPRLWGELYLEKPPTFFWLVLLAGSMVGAIGLSALVAPSLIAACGGLWLTARIARTWCGARAGMLVAAVLVTLPFYLICATLGRMDMPFSFFISLSTWWFYRGYVESRRWATIAAFAAAAVAVMIKGPLGILFPFGTAVAFLAGTGRLRRLLVWETLVGIGVGLAVLGAWLVPATIKLGPDYLERLLERHLVVAAVDGQNHSESPFFYVPIVPALWMPWVVFAPAAIPAAWRRWRSLGDDRDLWLLCWIAVPLAVLTIVKQKLCIYLLPTMAPLAILMGRHWSLLFSEASLRWVLCPSRILCVASGLTGVLFAASGWLVQTDAVAARRRELDTILHSLTAPHVLFATGVVALAFALFGWIGINRAARLGVRFVFAGVAASSIGAFLLLLLVVFPALDDLQSWWPVAQALEANRLPGEPVAAYRVNPYVGRYLADGVNWCKQPEALEQLLEEHESVLSVVPDSRLGEFAGRGLTCCKTDVLSPKGRVHVVRVRRRGCPEDYESPVTDRTNCDSDRREPDPRSAMLPHRDPTSVAHRAPNRDRK